MTHDLDKWINAFIGFDNSLFNTTYGVYPYTDVIKTKDGYQIDIALAGFTKKDIDVYVEDSKLIVKGKKLQETDKEYVTRSISKRAFTKEFALANTLEVKDVKLENGILSIKLKSVKDDKVKYLTIK